jgi:2'-5' RNA ligase
LDDLCEGLTEANWVAEEDFHLTLAFLGELPEHLIPKLVEAASVVRTPAFRLELESVGLFQSRGRPRVLWAGTRFEERLATLQRVLANELRQSGFSLERRRFHPHVTLARIEDCSVGDVSDWVARHLSFRAAAFGVFEFHLMQSVRPGHGPRYVSLARFSLRP